MSSINNYAIKNLLFTHNGTGGTSGTHNPYVEAVAGCSHVPVWYFSGSSLPIATKTPAAAKITRDSSARLEAVVWALTRFEATNQGITSVDTAAFPMLTRINLTTNNIEVLAVSKNTNLIYLGIANNYLTSLDLAANTKITTLNAYTNKLTSINITTLVNVLGVSVHQNLLTSLNTSANTKMTSLNCYENTLTSLNVSTNIKLRTIACATNSIASLNLSTCTLLESVSCHSNSMTTLTLPTGTVLTIISCQNNNLTALDVASKTGLTQLNAGNNTLVNVDMTDKAALTLLKLENNAITQTNLNSILSKLDAAQTINGTVKTLNVANQSTGAVINTGTAAATSAQSLKNKGWTITFSGTWVPT